MPQIPPDQRYSGYPRLPSVETRRIEALATGSKRIMWVTVVFMATYSLQRHAFGGDTGDLAFALGVAVLTGVLAFLAFDRFASGFGWSRFWAVLSAVLLAASGPAASWICHGSIWSCALYAGCFFVSMLAFRSRARIELKRLGFTAPKGPPRVQQEALNAFLFQRRKRDANPPVPANLFSGETPEGDDPLGHMGPR